MIIQFIEKLKTSYIVLASSSPRRQDILRNIGLQFSVVPSTFEEDLKIEDFSHPSEYVVATAVAKAEEVRDRLEREASEKSGDAEPLPDLVVGCDTCVTKDGRVFGKPVDDAHAAEMLGRWSGSNHEVISGVCLLQRQASDNTWKKVTFHETTVVSFATLSPELIAAYVNTGEPRGKAGGYGIQGMGGTLVEGIQGDYYNVMGFPLHHFCRQLLSLISNGGQP